jgi:lantibiotic modifying enzyme
VVVKEKKLTNNYKEYQREAIEQIWRKALTIEEKLDYCRPNFSQVSNNKLNEWKNIKGLIKEETFEEILFYRKITKEEFAFGVSDFKEEFPKNIPDWLLLVNEVFSEYIFKENEIDDIGVSVLPFINYVEQKIQATTFIDSAIDLHSEVQESFIHSYVVDILQIVSKVLVIELELYKKSHPEVLKDSDQCFNHFLKTIFSDKKSYYQFFSKYAVCTRQIATRTKFALDNYLKFIAAIEESQAELKGLLSISKLCIQKVHLSAGDSHEQGKNVSIVEISNKKVVYKPKNLEVTQSFEKLVSWFNQRSSLLEMKVPRGIYYKQYSFCEFISYDSCQTEEEVANFYRRLILRELRLQN